MICIPFTLNNASHVAQLSANQQKYVPTFIIERADDDRVTLFSSPPKAMAFRTDCGLKEGSENADYYFTPKVITEQGKTDVVIEIQKSEKSAQQFVLISIELPHTEKNICAVNVTFCLETDKRKTFRMRLLVCPQHCIYDAAIDFGSYSSQCCVASRDGNAYDVENVTKLFPAVLHNYRKGEEEKLQSLIGNCTLTDRDRYYQADPESKAFVRSNFFIQKELKAGSLTEKDFLFLTPEDHLLEIMQKTSDILNPKLADFEDIRKGEAIINGYEMSLSNYRTVVRKETLRLFVRTLLNHIASTIEGEIAVKLTLLIPDAYNQQQLARSRRHLWELVAEEKSAHIEGVEIDLVYEGSAALAGYLRADNLTIADEGKTVMICDIGAGTTDCSVSRLSLKEGKAEDIARAGVVGGGNLLTFAYLAAAANYVVKACGGDRNDTIRLLKSFGNLNDIAQKTNLFNAAERLKHTIDANEKTHTFEAMVQADMRFKKETNIQTLTPAIITELMEKAAKEGFYISENHPLILKYAALWAQKVYAQLYSIYKAEIPVDKLVFSGRGARCQAFTRELVRLLHPKTVDMVPLQHQKQISLIGALKNDLQLSREREVAGWPRVSLQEEIRQEEGTIDRWVKKVRLPNLYSLSNNNLAAVSSNYQDCQGSTLCLGDLEYITIGNAHYTLDGGQTGTYKVFFDGCDFVLRDNHRAQRLRPIHGSDRSEFVAESLFNLKREMLTEESRLFLEKRLMTVLMDIEADEII